MSTAGKGLDPILRIVKTQDECEKLRKIRNSLRLFMTNQKNKITYSEQKDWFDNLDYAKYTPYLYWKCDTPIGYGGIAFKMGVPWITGGVLEEYRGMGYGVKLFKELIRICNDNNYKKISLDVLITNEKAHNLYKKLGFQEITRSEEKIEMVFNIV